MTATETALNHQALLLINGERRAASDGGTKPIYSPATGEVIGEQACATASDVDEAVAVAKQAYRAWSALSAYKREDIIRAATAHARSKADEIGYLMALEQGKPLKQSRGEVIASCDIIDYYAAEGVRVEGVVNPTEQSNYRSFVVKQPVGVCAAITPWNYPVALLSWKLGPALAAGCSVVVKPTSVTPLCPSAFVAALIEGGLPPGLLAVVTGPGASTAHHLVAHRDVAKIGMTGSSAIGKQIMQDVAGQLKKISLELGGHCPAIVCADADIAKTAKAIAYKAFRNMGQSCSSINRIYAHRDIHDKLVAALTREAAAMSIGDGLAPPDVDLGPMCTASGLAKVEEHVAEARAQGARLVYGGERPRGLPAGGNWYQPTILTGMTQDMLIAREETFGPVAPFALFDDIEDAIERANDTAYGLASYLFTEDMSTTWQVGEALQHGSVCVNNVAVNTAYAPYQGWGDSGFGVELSRGAINEYFKIKHIKMELR